MHPATCSEAHNILCYTGCNSSKQKGVLGSKQPSNPNVFNVPEVFSQPLNDAPLISITMSPGSNHLTLLADNLEENCRGNLQTANKKNTHKTPEL